MELKEGIGALEATVKHQLNFGIAKVVETRYSRAGHGSRGIAFAM
jgi:hypothetical protein